MHEWNNQGPLYFRSPLFQRRNNPICAKVEMHKLSKFAFNDFFFEKALSTFYYNPVRIPLYLRKK